MHVAMRGELLNPARATMVALMRWQTLSTAGVSEFEPAQAFFCLFFATLSGDRLFLALTPTSFSLFPLCSVL